MMDDAAMLLDKLTWRYATKKMDPGKAVPADNPVTRGRTLPPRDGPCSSAFHVLKCYSAC